MNSLNINNKETEVSEFRKKQKRNQEIYNPCFKEHNLSLKCLEANKYDYAKCDLYFENYKICKKFWGKIVANRRQHDIRPYIPLPEDRQKIKDEYLHSQKR